MLTDIEIKKKGLRVLIENLGDVNAEKFISLIIKEPFDYTEWQGTLWNRQSVESVSDKAMQYRNQNKTP
jgi:hypothetical protein